MRRRRRDEFYTVAEAADVLGVSPSTVWRWIDAEKLPALRVGPKAIRIRRNEVAKAITVRRPRSRRDSLTPRSPLLVEPLTVEEQRQGLRAVEEARKFHAKLLGERNGKPLPPSWPLIRAARDERAPPR